MILRAILKEYNAGSHTACAQLVGSTTTYFDDLKVARNIPADEMVLGRHVYVTIPDDSPGPAAIITAVFDA
jgi:hypothetical protein